ncbi:MAG: hypothetical protein R2851_03725 [Caldilineaceae bacterium]
MQALVTGGEAQAEAAQQVMDTWSKMLDETLKTQSEWMKRWHSPSTMNNESRVTTIVQGGKE